MLVTDVDPAALAADAARTHAQPIVDEGPCDLAVVYAIPGTGFDVIVNGDHLAVVGRRQPIELQEAALRNLATWSATAAWTDEVSGERRLISSDTGDGWDAARILLPEVRDRLTAELGGGGPRPDRPARAASPDRGRAAARTTRPSRTCSRSSSSSIPVARTSRSIAGCSSSSTADSSTSPRTPPAD